MRALIALAILTQAARAEPAGDQIAAFARHVEIAPAAVTEVAGFELPSGGDFTHVIAGRYRFGGYTMAGVVLLACDAGGSCEGRRADFGAVEELAIAGLVDLEGAALALPSRAVGHPAGSPWTKLRGGRAKWPALIVRATERRAVARGTETRTRLYLISLVDRDRGMVVLQDTAAEREPSGATFTRTYRLERSGDGKRLELMATERASRCSKPAEIRFKRDGRHFKAADFVDHESC